MITYLVEHLMISSLRKAFRRICWTGPIPDFDENRPVICYANHHTFHDGYLLWLVSKKLLQRDVILWMEDWDRFPFFAAVGARPFPLDDTSQRIKTIRRTSQHLKTSPRTTLIYFPEGKLHPPEEGILPFPPSAMPRMSRVLPDAHWWPIAMHMTTLGDAHPSLFITGNSPHQEADGNERDRLTASLASLRAKTHPCSQVLLEGTYSPDESWDMGFMRPFFKRYL